MKRIVASLLIAGALFASSFSSVLAVGGPWEPGNSDHFKHNSPPCSSDNNPHCPPFGN